MANEKPIIPQDGALQQYFASLAPHIKETIYQSGIQIETEEQLKSCVKNLTQQH